MKRREFLRSMAAMMGLTFAAGGVVQAEESETATLEGTIELLDAGDLTTTGIWTLTAGQDLVAGEMIYLGNDDKIYPATIFVADESIWTDQ